MYVANYDDRASKGENGNIGSIGAIITATNVLASPLITCPPPVPPFQPCIHPVALVETPDGKKLYAVNQGSGNVASINTASRVVTATISTGSAPVWAVARSDNARVYVLDSITGNVISINTLEDTSVSGTVSGGAGANFMAYDKAPNRIYIVNPSTAVVTIADVSADPPAQLAQVPVCSGCHPVSVAVLPD